MGKIVLIAVISILTAHNVFAAPETVVLLTEKEGLMEASPSGPYEMSRTLNQGPEIKIIVPRAGEEYKSPARVMLLFSPQNGREVDLTRLKVECLKLIDIDITERVLPYTTKEGIRIDNAKLPTGEHKIRVTIGDTAGGITRQVFVMKISE